MKGRLTDTDLIRRFGWWWRNPAKALKPRLQKHSARQIGRLFDTTLSEPAFNYELAARAAMQPGDKPSYQYGAPFNQLDGTRWARLMFLWPSSPHEPMYEALPYEEQPFSTSALAELEDDLVESRDVGASRNAHMAQLKARADIIARAARPGWTLPQYLRFNLRAHSDGTIAAALEKWLKVQRGIFGIPEPAKNAGRRNRTVRGRSFHSIETLDVWTHLSRNEVKQVNDSRKSAPVLERISLFDESQMRKARKEAAIRREALVSYEGKKLKP